MNIKCKYVDLLMSETKYVSTRWQRDRSIWNSIFQYFHHLGQACVEIWSRQEVGTGVDRQLGIAHIDHGSLDNMTFKKRLTKGGRVGLITNYISNNILTTLTTLTTKKLGR